MPASKMEGEIRKLDVSKAKRLKTLEDENLSLKWLLAYAMLDNAALKDLLGKECILRLVRASVRDIAKPNPVA